MSEKVITIPPDAAVKDAARIMLDKKIGCLPVIEAKKLIGIITETDILRHVFER